MKKTEDTKQPEGSVPTLISLLSCLYRNSPRNHLTSNPKKSTVLLNEYENEPQKAVVVHIFSVLMLIPIVSFKLRGSCWLRKKVSVLGRRLHWTGRGMSSVG